MLADALAGLRGLQRTVLDLAFNCLSAEVRLQHSQMCKPKKRNNSCGEMSPKCLLTQITLACSIMCFRGIILSDLVDLGNLVRCRCFVSVPERHCRQFLSTLCLSEYRSGWHRDTIVRSCCPCCPYRQACSNCRLLASSPRAM